MKILSLKMENFKNIKSSKINFRSNLSGIYGPNGTGKTAVIEALDVIRLYFNPLKTKDQSEELKNKVARLINIDSNRMILEVVFTNEDFQYKLKLGFQKDRLNSENIYVTNEEFLYREIIKKSVFKNIITVDNNVEMIIPQINFKGKFSIKNNKQVEEILKSKEISLKSLYFEFDKLNSLFSLVYEQMKELEKEKLNTEINLFMIHWEKMKTTIMTMFVVTLKEQALYNLEILLPLKAHTENAHGTLPINFGKNRGNIYEEKIVEDLEKIIEQIGDIFSVIIPDSKLILEKKDDRIENDSKKIAVSLYVEKNGNRICVENESTGIIKLISLLSALVYYVQDERAIVLIDELDIHIFEYLLAIMLEKLSKYAKGQLIFTAHNLLPLEKLNRNSIIISTIEKEQTAYVYFKGTSGTTNLRQKYLRSQTLCSESNISPLLLNEYALELYLRKLVK
ncbi:MAG: AAA family ATPase [Cetobacterium sp.]